MNASLLLADCGHSRLKLHCYNPGQRPQRQSLELRPFTPPAKLNCTECLVMGTNRHFMEHRLLSWLASWLEAPVHLLGRDLRVPIQTLANPEQTGNDRLAMALGASQRYPGERCLCISAGSALVIDLINEQGQHEGGLISTGLECHHQALEKLNPALKSETPPKPSYPGRDTEQAINAGWIEPALALIKLQQEKQKVSQTVLCGGDAHLLHPHITGSHLHPELGADAMAQALGYLES
jgi:pantothenate kinase type III